MTKQDGSHWHCVNRDCGWSSVLVQVSESETALPHCVCGAAMERAELPPVFSYLDFLWGDEPLVHADGRDEE